MSVQCDSQLWLCRLSESASAWASFSLPTEADQQWLVVASWDRAWILYFFPCPVFNSSYCAKVLNLLSFLYILHHWLKRSQNGMFGSCISPYIHEMWLLTSVSPAQWFAVASPSLPTTASDNEEAHFFCLNVRICLCPALRVTWHRGKRFGTTGPPARAWLHSNQTAERTRVSRLT